MESREKTKAELAELLATKWHTGQTRKNRVTPYIEHPKAVARLVGEWYNCVEFKEDIVCVALLHDVIEDCGISSGEIKAVFGGGIARAVEELTFLGPIEEKPQHIKELAKNGSVAAVLVKMADRMSNTADFLYDGKWLKAWDYFSDGVPLSARALNETQINSFHFAAATFACFAWSGMAKIFTVGSNAVSDHPIVMSGLPEKPVVSPKI